MQSRLLPASWPLWLRYTVWFLLSAALIFCWESTAKYHAPRFIAEWFGPVFSFFGVPALLIVGVAILLGLVGKRAGAGRSILVLSAGLLAPIVIFFLVLMLGCAIGAAVHLHGACI